MARVQTLNEMGQLERSQFGRPPPRHGLKLLYWFATECVHFDDNNDMVSGCEPDRGDYGFHKFENRYDQNGIKLLPDVDYPYYVVGNLNYDGAGELPGYVTKDYTGRQDGSNMDRIIISLDDELIDRVYVTEHIDRSNYNANATYRITKGLILIIRNLKMEDFLWKTGYPVNITALMWNHIPQPIKTMVHIAPVTPKVSHPRNQDTCIDIESQMASIALGDSDTDVYPRSNRRRRCCECTIL